MDWLAIIASKHLVPLGTFLLGIVSSFVTTRLLSRRGVFAYRVTHQPIGLSADDQLFGSIRITWEGKELRSLWLTTLELKNKSMNDYKDVTIKVFSAQNTSMLTERTQVSGSIDPLNYTEEYKRDYISPPGGNASEEQVRMQLSYRYYLAPVINRSQSISFQYMTSVIHDTRMLLQPGVWIDIQHPGVLVKQTSDPVTAQDFLSVPIKYAAYVGIPIAIAVSAICAATIDNSLLLSGIILTLGILVVVPGALAIRLYQWCKSLLAG